MATARQATRRAVSQYVHMLCCVTCVCACVDVRMYACMYMPCVCHDCMWYKLHHPSRHADNANKHSQTGEPASTGHPIIADRMPRTEGLSRLVSSTARWLARSAFSRLLPTTARRYGFGPLFDLHSYAKSIPKPPRTTREPRPLVARLSIHSSLAWLAGSARQFSDRSSRLVDLTERVPKPCPVPAQPNTTAPMASPVSET